MNAVKTNLKRLRLAKGMTQDDLAGKLHVVRQTVSSWETGKTTPDLESLAAIAEALEVDIKELIYGPMPVDSFAAKRPKRIQRAVIFIFIAILFGLLGVFWSDMLTAVGLEDTASADFNLRSFRHLLHVFGASVFPAAGYTLLGIALTLILAAWRDFSFVDRRVRIGLFLVGVIYLVCCTGIVFLPWFGPIENRMLVLTYYFLAFRRYLFLIGGALVGCGIAETCG